MHITAAHKKEVDKASISLPVPRTLKLSTINTRPFILESCIPIEEFRTRYPPELLFDIILEARRIRPHSIAAVIQRISLSGTTLHSVASPHRFSEIPNLQPDVAQDLQQRDSASSIILEPHLYNIDPEPVKKAHSFPNYHSRIISSEDVGDPIEQRVRQGNIASEDVADQIEQRVRQPNRSSEDVAYLIGQKVRQRKSPRRQIPKQNVD